jgi:hypothetical protein
MSLIAFSGAGDIALLYLGLKRNSPCAPSRQQNVGIESRFSSGKRIGADDDQGACSALRSPQALATGVILKDSVS